MSCSFSTFSERTSRSWIAVAISVSWCHFSVALAQSGPLPSYIESLSPYEAARLDGTLAPASGNVSMRDITPAEWVSNDPGVVGLEAVISAWNGGAKSVGSQLFVHGGGHSDSANNGMYIFDFSGNERPLGWLDPLVISSVSAVQSNRPTYSDGLPTAVHTYDGLIHAQHNNNIYRFAGSQYNNGFMAGGTFKFDGDTRVWTQLADYPGQRGGAKTVYDSNTGKIFVTMNDSLEGFFFRTSNDSWSGSKGYSGNGFPYDSVGVWDPTRGRGLIVGAGEKSLVEIDFDNESVDVSGVSISGSTEIFGVAGISALFDAVTDAYWFFGGSQSSSGWTRLYRMDADGPPWNVTSVSLSGDAIQRTSGMIGSYGRFVFMPNWRAIGLVAVVDGPAVVIRLPGEAFISPNPPADFDVN